MSDQKSTAHTRRARERLLAAACAALTLGAAWLSSLSGLPAAPVDAPPAASTPQYDPNAWHYPNSSNLYFVEADDFSLAKDGSFELRGDYRPGGLTQGYLENCMKLTPPAPFTVEPLGEGRFRIHLEGGQSIPRTLVELPQDPDAPYREDPFTAWIEPHLAARINTDEGNGGAPIDRPFRIEFSFPMDFGESPQTAITFSPGLPCSMEASGDTVTVTPDGMMPYGALYTVSISAALTGVNGESFPADQVLEFTTEERDFSLIMTDQLISTTVPGEPVSMEYQLDTAGNGAREGEVALYSLGNGAAAAFDNYLSFLETMPLPQVTYLGKDYDRQNFVYQTGPGAVPPDSMTEIDVWKGAFPEGLSTVEFDNPGPGFYVVRTTVTDTKTGEPFTWYKPVQVTTPSVYMQSAKGQSLLWLNDSVSGEPLAGYTIRFLRGDFDSELASAVTGPDGTALLEIVNSFWEEDYTSSGAAPGEQTYRFTGFKNASASMTPEEAEQHNSLSTVFVIYDRQGTPVYADTTASLSEMAYPENRYYSFLYLDRALYRPTDEINFWGYLKPYAHNPAPTPRQLEVCLDPDGMNLVVPVQVAPDGTYSGVIPLDKAASAEYQICVRYAASDTEQSLLSAYYGPGSEQEGTRVLDIEWIEVNQFQKPAYTIEAEVEKPIYRWGDEIFVTIHPSFFDGTPAPYMPLECSVFNPSTGNLDAVTTVETDETGAAVYRFHAGDGLSFDYSQTWTPKRAYFYIKITGEGENVTYQGHYNYVPGDVALRPEMEITEGGNARLTILANQISLDAIQTEDDLEGLVFEPYYSDDISHYDALLGEPADISLSAKVKVEYCRPYDGTYDEKYYDYTEQERTFTIDVADGQAVLENLAGMERRPDTYLYTYAEVSYDAPGCKIAESDSAFNNFMRFQSSEEAAVKGYSFNVYLNGGQDPVQEREEFMSLDVLEAGAGDSIRFALCRDGQELSKPGGKLLYTVLQDSVVEHGVAQDTLELTGKPDYANSVMVVAAYFDGKDVYPVSNCEITFSRESARLNIETSADKESYLPGDKVTLRAKVTDQTGKPVSANLCLSVVDEAVFALRDQTFNLLEELYGKMWFYNYFVNKYTTRTGDIDPYNAGGDGGKGDGDNLLAYDMYRKDFKDTALFYPAKSDASGEASVTFTLPDNLTSWRVTALAVDGAPFGGQSRSQVITSLPFFIKPVLSSKYIAGDEVSMLLKGHGTAVEPDSTVEYTVIVRGNGIEDTRTFRQSGGVGAMISLGKLPEGDYTVISTSVLGERRDTVELPVSVIHNNLELTLHQSFDPRETVSFPASRYPVTITLYNEAFQSYYDGLNSLLLPDCGYLERRLARYIAKQALLRTCTEDALPTALRGTNDLSVFQRDSGGVSAGMSDNGWPGEGADPVLTAQAVLLAPEQISTERARRYLLEVTSDSTMKPVEQAAAWAGLAAMDPSYAESIGSLMTAPAASLTERLWYGIGLAYAGDEEGALAFYNDALEPMLDRRGGVVRMTGVGKQWENDEASALAWVIASRLNLEDNDGYAKYFVNGTYLFAHMAYVKNYPLSPSPIRFNWTGGGQSGEIDLSVTGSQTLTLGGDMLEDLAFQGVPEGVAGMAYYIGEPEEAGIAPSEHFTISKTVEALENGKYRNTVTVKLDNDAPYGYYSISDWIPSNARLHSVMKPALNTIAFYHMQEGQKLYFEFYHNQKDGGMLTIQYLTRRVYGTEAVQDRTYLICAENGEIAYTERGILE